MGRVVIPGFRKIEVSGGGEGGTGNYNDLTNKPSINNVPLVGNLNTVNLKLTDKTLTEEGVPAEAKTVGTKLEEHSTSLTAVKEELTKKANTSDIPTKVSELQNDSNYQTDTDVTNTLTTYATKTYVVEQISSADHLKREIVTEIPSPETADNNTIYMLKIESATGDDKYKEYLLIDGTVQCIGDTSVDLTDYAKKTEIPTELPANGGNSLTVNGHTVKSDVPENAVFTDTVYDDTEVKKSITELNSNLSQLEYEIYDNSKSQWADGAYTSTGDTNQLDGFHRTVNYTEVTPNTTYTVSNSEKANFSNGICYYDANKNFLSWDFYVENGKTFKTPSNCKYIRFTVESVNIPTSVSIKTFNSEFLTEEVNAQNESLGVIGKCKNLLNPTLKTTTQNGVTCIDNGDGTYTLNGTATGSFASFIIGSFNLIKGIKYAFCGCPKDGSYTKYRCSIWDIIECYGNTEIFEVDEDITKNISIRIEEGITVSNLTFKPMITTNLNATYDDFVPYTGDGDTLTADVASLKNDLDKLNALPIGTIIQIEAEKDTIATTEAKYSWQYLGTSNIQYENGSSTILATNVYRKNN